MHQIFDYVSKDRPICQFLVNSTLPQNASYPTFTTHCGILEHWNSQKSLTNIQQHFSCRLYEGIAKICKKKKKKITMAFSDNQSTLSVLRFIPPVHVHLKTDNVDYLKKPSWKKIVYFCNPLIKSTWKMLSNVCKTFLAISML